MNALLKSLEEPADNTYYLLTSYQTYNLLDTLLSRVQKFKICINSQQIGQYLLIKYKMKKEDIEKALLTTHSNLNMIEKIKKDSVYWKIRQNILMIVFAKANIIDFLALYEKQYANEILFWLSLLILDLVKIKLSKTAQISFFNNAKSLQEISEKISHESLENHYQDIVLFKKQLSYNTNLNYSLKLEALLLKLQLRK